MGIELVVFATVFTLIILLTGGPGNTLSVSYTHLRAHET